MQHSESWCSTVSPAVVQVASVTGQIAGAVYGCSGIPDEWLTTLMEWDRNGEIALRAYKLYHKHYLP